MRLLYTRKQFQGELNKVVSPLNKEIEELNRVIANKEFEYLSAKEKLEKENCDLKAKIEQMEEIIIIREEEIQKLNYEKKKITGAKGGLTKQLNKVEKELTEANEKLSQRYILKELVAEKSKNTQKMKTRSNLKTSNIIKNIKGE